MSTHYPAEFKQQAVALVTISHKSITQAALELGVSKGTFYYWLGHQGQGSRTLKVEGPSMDPAQEIKRLRAQNEAMQKENIRLRAERDDAKEENRAAKLVIEYFRTHTPPKSLAPVNAHLNRQGILSKYRREVLAISRSTSYLLEPAGVISKMKRARKKNLRREIEKLRARLARSLGYRPIHALLVKEGISCSAYLVRKVMKLAGLAGLPKKRKYPKGNYEPEIGNLINGNFQSTIPHEKYFIDITQKRYLSGTIYLAVIKDASSRMVVGYATGRRPNSESLVRALTIATDRHTPKGTIVHADMGSVFKSEHYRNAVKQAGPLPSMGNAGLSFANLMVESFFGKIKTELLHTRRWKSYEEIDKAIIEFCENFYNSIRSQMVLGGRTPLEEFHRLITCTRIPGTASVA